MAVMRESYEDKKVVINNIASVAGTVASGAGALEIGAILFLDETSGEFKEYVHASYTDEKIGILTEAIDATSEAVNCTICLAGTVNLALITAATTDAIVANLYKSQIFAM